MQCEGEKGLNKSLSPLPAARVMIRADRCLDTDRCLETDRVTRMAHRPLAVTGALPCDLRSLSMLPPAFFLLPIPKDFWSEYLDAPFAECIDCGGSLQHASVYVIQKKLVAGEAVFEMALCESCRDALTVTYSEETKANINRRMKEQFESNERRDAAENPVNGSSQLLDKCLNYCLFCGIHRNAVSRYSIAGLFHQETVVVQRNTNGQSPVMVCDQCERLLIPLISKQTRDSWDRFVAEHFDGPPGVEHDAPRDQPIMF